MGGWYSSAALLVSSVEDSLDNSGECLPRMRTVGIFSALAFWAHVLVIVVACGFPAPLRVACSIVIDMYLDIILRYTYYIVHLYTA